jgi:arabinogalactan endo-1,4-beta-galactosidase
MTSKDMLSGLGFGTKNYFPGSGWNDKWRANVSSAVRKLGEYVSIWQIDNELNHPGHNFLPWLNKGLSVNIVEEGIHAVREFDSESKIVMNLFYRRGTIIPGLYFPNDTGFITKFKERFSDDINILGLDIYRGTWHKGTPALYKDDITRYHNIWGGDIMIMETGYCLDSFGHTPEGQGQYVHEVFDAIKNHCNGSPWFKGMFWYEFDSKHSGLPCEEYFGLHIRDGQYEHPAWEIFGEKVSEFKKFNKIFGITYHY